MRPVSLLAAVGFAVVTVGTAVYRPRTRVDRQYRAILLVVFGASAVAYAGVGLGVGWRAGESILWPHYLEWLVGTPPYVAGLFLLTGDRRTVLAAVALDLLMVAAGTGAALRNGGLALFGVSTLALVGLFGLLVTAAPAAGWRRDLFVPLRRLFLAVGPGYPVVWLVGTDGLALVGPGTTNLGFLVLDAVVKVGFAAVLVRHAPLGADPAAADPVA